MEEEGREERWDGRNGVGCVRNEGREKRVGEKSDGKEVGKEMGKTR